MNKEVSNLLMGSIFAVLISGCAGDSDSKKAEPNRETPQVLSELEKASCEFKAEEGGAAPTDTPASKLTVSHFQKVFDESLVLPVLSANAMETVRFAKNSQLQIYSVGAMSTKSCKMFAFIPSADSTQQNVFTDLQKGTSKDSTILGVYFPPESKQFKGINKDAFILIRQDTTRWTLVHEYMHHLFSKEVQAVKRDLDLKSELDQELSLFEKNYDAYKINGSNQNLFALSKSVEKMVGLRIELLKRYTLEEITIESYLSAHYNTGKLKYVPRIDLAGAKAYIKSNVKVAQDNNSSLTKLIDFATEALASIIKESAELADEAKLVETKVNTHKTTLSALMTEVSALERKNLYGFSESILERSAADANHSAGCSHSNDTEVQATAAIQKMLTNIESVAQ